MKKSTNPINRYFLRSDEETADAVVNADPPIQEQEPEVEEVYQVEVNQDLEEETDMSSHITLPPFHGNQGEKASEWLLWYENYATIHNFNQQKLKISLPFFLKSHARVWYDHIPEDIKSDYDMLKEGLVDRFNGEDDVMSDIDMLSLKQREEESIAEYMTRILRGTNGKGYPQQLLVSMALNGLNGKLKTIVMPQNPSNLENLRKAATIAEKTIKATTTDVSVANIHQQLLDAVAMINLAPNQKVAHPTGQQQGYRQQPNVGYPQPMANQRDDYRQPSHQCPQQQDYHQQPRHRDYDQQPRQRDYDQQPRQRDYDQQPRQRDYDQQPRQQSQRQQPRPINGRRGADNSCGRCGATIYNLESCRIKDRLGKYPLARPLFGNVRLIVPNKANTLLKVCHCQFHSSACLCSSDDDGFNKTNENKENDNVKDGINEQRSETDKMTVSQKDQTDLELSISEREKEQTDLESGISEREKEQTDLESCISEREKEDIRSWIEDVDKPPDKGSHTRNNELLRLPPENLDTFLDERGIIYDKGHTCHHTVCPKLGKLAMKKRQEGNKMFINSLTGYFHCNYCGAHGDWHDLRDMVLMKSATMKRNQECFKDNENVGRTLTEPPAQVVRQLVGSHDFSTLTNDQFDTIVSMFDWKGIHLQTFINHGVRYKIKEDKYSILFPMVTTSGVTSSIRVYTATVSEDGDVKLGPVTRMKQTSDVFGWKMTPSKDVLVITSGEVNAMVISQETKQTVLALPDPTHLPQELLPDIEDFNKIILWVGTDVHAWDNTKLFAKKLSDKRSYIFRPNTVTKMPLGVLHDGQDKLSVILSKAYLISHKAILTFSNFRDEVYAEMANYGQVAGVKWKRFTKLNSLLKGHRRGELTILTGPTGSGKTTFVSEYSLDLCMQGVNTLWGSFEISNVRLVKTMMHQFAGKNLTKNLQDFNKVADEFSTLSLFFMTYFGQEPISKVLEAMSHAVYVHDINHVIVDNLQFMMGMDYNENNRFIKQDQIVSMFRRFATEKNCHVTLIIHPRKINEGEELSTASIFGSAKISQEADNILLIQDQRLKSPSGKKYIQITKNRFDGDLGAMVLKFNKHCLSYTVVEKKKVEPDTDSLEGDGATSTTIDQEGGNT